MLSNDSRQKNLGNSPAFLENDLELVQHIFLNRKADSKQNLPLNVGDVKRVLSLVSGQSVLFFNTEFETKNKKESNKQYIKRLNLLAAGLLYRNWAYPIDLLEIIPEMYAPLYEHQLYGKVVEAFSTLISYFISKFIKNVREFCIDNDIASAMPVDELIDTLVKLADSRVLDNLFIFSANELAAELKLDSVEIVNILDRLSIVEGSISDRNYAYAFKSFYIAEKPFIKLSDKKYALYSITALQTYFEEMLLNILSQQYPDWNIQEYNKVRSNYLEQKTYQLLKENFPASVFLIRHP